MSFIAIYVLSRDGTWKLAAPMVEVPELSPHWGKPPAGYPDGAPWPPLYPGEHGYPAPLPTDSEFAMMGVLREVYQAWARAQPPGSLVLARHSVGGSWYWDELPERGDPDPNYTGPAGPLDLTQVGRLSVFLLFPSGAWQRLGPVPWQRYAEGLDFAGDTDAGAIFRGWADTVRAQIPGTLVLYFTAYIDDVGEPRALWGEFEPVNEVPPLPSL